MKIITLYLLLLTSFSVYSQVTELLTPRLMSTGGAGVGSLLVEEAAFVNPSSIAFFSNSSLYYQRTNLNMDQDKTSNTQPQATSSNAVVLTDTSGPVKGTLSYQNHKNYFGERTRFATSLSGLISPSQSVGVLYRYTKDNTNSIVPGMTNQLQTKNYHQVVYGTTKIVSESLTLGALISDPFTSKVDNSFASIGAQLSYQDMISVMFDLEANYRKSAQQTLSNKAGLQLRLFDDFYLRFGRFENKSSNIKGTGWGIGWNGPNMNLIFGMSQSSQLDEKLPGVLEKGQQYHEASLAVSIKV